MKRTLIIAALLMVNLFMINTANADLDQALDDMCDKMKTCSTEEIKRQGLSDDMVTMMSAMFDGMCKTWVNPYANAMGEAGLEKKAEACIDSMVSASCETLMQSEGEFLTDECEAFEKAADEAGVDLDNVSD